MKGKKLLTAILALMLGAGCGLFTGCEKSYTQEETDALILQLQTAMESNQAELNVKLEELKQEYKGKDAELESTIAILKAGYDKKLLDIQTLIATIQATDNTQNEKIAQLTQQVLDLTEATTITDIVFNENGDLVITFADGSTQIATAPQAHEHTFGDWINFTAESLSCEERLFYRVCSSCDQMEWKHGSSDDHDWKEDYSSNNSYHWYDCETCGEIKRKEEHIDTAETGVCTVCNALVGPTEGVLYAVVDGKASVLGYTGTATRVRIAETYEGVPVTAIADRAFYHCSDLTEIILPEGITTIGLSAFSGCSSLTEIIIPNGITTIAYDLFSDCWGLRKVVIPESVISIGNRAFYGCSSLTEIVIPAGVASIEGSTFWGCSSLTEVVIPESVTLIEGSAFAYCTSLTSITFVDTTTWRVKGEVVDVSDPTINAMFLTKTYSSQDWTKE